MRAVIVGAGIGGLTTALCLHKFGWQVRIVEKSASIDEVGAGIQLSPNAMKVFEKLDLDREIIDAGFLPEAIEMRLGISGMRLIRSEVRTGCMRRYGSPYVHIHRADLINVLIKAVNARLSTDAISLNSNFEAYENRRHDVTVSCTGQEQLECDLLVGADGIRSSVRTQFLGSDRPRFTGNVAWRAVVPVENLRNSVPDPTACVWVGRRKHAVTYLLRNGELANLVGVVEQNEWTNQDWTVEGSREEALKDFEGWHPTITSILEKSNRLYKWALFDRHPLTRWSDGRVVIIGDAAHPMLPFLAQGGAMSIEDAWALANCVSRDNSIKVSLNDFYKMRINRTTMIHRLSRKYGRLFHLNSSFSRLMTYAPVWMLGTLFPKVGLIRHDSVFADPLDSSE